MCVEWIVLWVAVVMSHACMPCRQFTHRSDRCRSADFTTRGESLCGLPAAQQVIPVHAAQTSCDCAVQNSQRSSRSYWTRSVASKRNANPLAVEQIWVSFRTSAMHRVKDSASVLHVAGLLAENISTSNSEPPRLGVMKDLPARGR